MFIQIKDRERVRESGAGGVREEIPPERATPDLSLRGRGGAAAG